jgi:broad specificity phosphatase PhoE
MQTFQQRPAEWHESLTPWGPQTRMIELVLCRHGESVRNYASRLAHQGDFTLLRQQLVEDAYEPGWPLTDRGWEQAASTGAWLRQSFADGFDFAYVSPYNRTLQTAKGLGLEQEFVQDWRLRERHWGDVASAEGAYSAEQYLGDLGKCLDPEWKADLPGSEALSDLTPQVRKFVQDRLFGLVRGSVLVVGHGGTLKAMQMVLAGGDCLEHDPHLANASVVHYRIERLEPSGRAAGEVQQSCPWQPGPETPWHHFG